MSRIVFYHPAPEWDGLARVYLEVGKALAARAVTVALACPEESDVAAACGVFEILPVQTRGSWFSDGIRLSATLREFVCDAIVVAGDDAQLLAAWAIRRSRRGAVFRRMRTGIALQHLWIRIAQRRHFDSRKRPKRLQKRQPSLPRDSYLQHGAIIPLAKVG